MWVENHGEELRGRITRDQHGAPTEPEIHNFLACWNHGDESPGYRHLAPPEPEANFLWASVNKGMNPLATNIWLLRSLKAIF